MSNNLAIFSFFTLELRMKKIKILNLSKIDSVLLLGLFLLLLAHYAAVFPQKIDSEILVIASVLATIPVIFSAGRSLAKRKLSIDLLAAIALIASLISNEWTSAVFINLMLTSARLFSSYTENRARRAIESLLKLKPKIAKIEDAGKIKEIPIEKIKKGDLVVAELGERIPIDGTVYEGQALIDQSSLTGESVPLQVKKGDTVLSSSMVEDGSLLIRAEKIGKETALEKIIDLVEKSQANKAPIHTVSEKFTSRYIFITILGSFLLYLFSHNMSLVLSVLLVTCADDIAIAIPLAFMAAIGHAAKRGVIIKGGSFIEGLTKLKILLVDKTGTLTQGKLKVHKFVVLNGMPGTKVLEITGALSMLSNHPSAKAILEFAKEAKIQINPPEKFEEHSGKGSIALHNNRKIFSGKLSFLKEHNVPMHQRQLADIDTEKQEGLTMTLFGDKDGLICYFALADELRPKIKETIAKIKNLGIEKIVMLTGDNEKTAKRIAQLSQIEEFHANLMPADKLNYIKKYLNPKYKVAMIGDGVNDAAALGLADIGIAMGVIGSDVAIESADIALMKDDFSKIPEIISLSKFTVKITRQDMLIWGIVNFIGLGLAFGGFLMPAGAAAYNFITDFLPLLNSTRLFRLHLKHAHKK